MNEEWLKTLQAVIQKDLLFLGYAEKSFFQELIITFLEFLTPEPSEILVKRNLTSAKLMIETYEPSSILNSYIFNNLKKIFNTILDIQKQHTKGIKEFKLESEEKHQENSILHHLSLFSSYRRLKANIDIPLEEEKKILEEIEKQITLHPKGTAAHYAFTMIRDYKTETKINVNLSYALKLVWKAINSLAQTQANECKTLLIDQLVKIHETSIRFPTKKLPLENILLTLFQVINRKTPDVFVINSIELLPQLIKTRCHTLLELEIQKHSHEEQSNLFHKLDEKDNEIKNKFWWNFSENSQQILQDEFSMFNLLQNKNIQKEIQDYIQEYINESTTSLWLKDNIKNGHYANFKSSNNNGFDKKQSLLRCLNLEIKCKKNAERTKTIQHLHDTLTKTNSKQKDSIDNLCARFERLIMIDKMRHQLEEIKEKKEISGWKLSFSTLDIQIKSYEKQINSSYAELKWENRQNHFGVLSKSFPNLTHNGSTLQKKLQRYSEDNQSIFNPSYQHRESYSVLTNLIVNPLDKVIALFNDYHSKGFFYFHWNRHHKNEASKLVDQFKIFKNNNNSLDLAKEYLKNIKNYLLINNQLNLVGSFSRRIEFSLQLLEEATTPRMNPLSQSVHTPSSKPVIFDRKTP